LQQINFESIMLRLSFAFGAGGKIDPG